jgi:hypothetical protein
MATEGRGTREQGKKVRLAVLKATMRLYIYQISKEQDTMCRTVGRSLSPWGKEAKKRTDHSLKCF